MDQVRKDHTSTFTKHMLVCNPTLGLEFLKQIHVHYNMNLDLEMFVEKLHMLAFAHVTKKQKVSWLKLWN